MFDVAVSQVTTPRWDLAQELAALAENGLAALSLWRPKLSDAGLEAVVAAVETAGVRVSSLQSVGGFTGSDGRTFSESVADAAEAITVAAALGGGEAGLGRRPIVVVQSGCRAGHTRSHAVRLLVDALESLAPLARAEGVVLAVLPVHERASAGSSFLTRLDEAVALVEGMADPHVRLALDLWQFADDPEFEALLPRLAATTALVRVADRCGPPTGDGDRLLPERGDLPLADRVHELIEGGFAGDFEFDPVGEAVQELGYAAAFSEIRRVADAWTAGIAAATPARLCRVDQSHQQLRDVQRRGAGAGSRRSQASTQAVSRG
jgi:sugar phosphate isomerase/epimerase